MAKLLLEQGRTFKHGNIAMPQRPKELTGLVTIQGLIVPVAWEKSGKPCAYGLAAFDETQYALGPPALLELFGEIVRQVVEIEGTLEQDREGVPLLQVVSHRVLSSPANGVGASSQNWKGEAWD